MNSPAPMVVLHSYAGVKRMTAQAARKHLNAHLKYMEHRSRSEQESRDDRRIFGERSNVVNRKDIVREVMEHVSQRDAYYHKVMLSPGPDIPVSDYRQWTRDLMGDLEQRLGKKLHWYAVQHHNTDHPHVHLIVAGAGERLDTGKPEAVFIRPAEYTFLKQQGREHSDLAHQHLIETTLREIDKQDNTLARQQEVVQPEGFDR